MFLHDYCTLKYDTVVITGEREYYFLCLRKLEIDVKKKYGMDCTIQ